MNETQKISKVDTLSSPPISVPCIGRISGTNKHYDVLVEYDNSDPKVAKLVAGLVRSDLIKQENQGRQVLIVFENGDPELPIIIALMEAPFENLLSSEVANENRKEDKDVLIDGKRITIEAKDEIELKCGKGSILIKKDGKIVVKGTNLLSRSSGPQRIKGASVNIN